MLFGAEESVVAKIAEKLAANLLKYIDYILYGLLGLLVVLFVVGLVCALTNGELNAFKKLAKQYLGGQIKGETAVMKQMPVRLKKLYKRAKKTPGYKPSDFLTPDACIFAPFNASFASKFTAFTAYLSVVVALLGLALGGLAELGIGYNAMVLVGCVTVLGAVLTAIAALVSRSVRSGSYKTYLKFIDRIDGEPAEQPTQNFAGAANYEQPAQNYADATSYEQPAQQYAEATGFDHAAYNVDAQAEAYQAEEPAVEQETVYEQPVYAAPESDAQPFMFTATESIAYEAVTEEPAVVVEQPAEDPAAARAKAKAEAVAAMKAEQERIRLEQEERARKEQAEQAAKEAAAKEAAAAKARAQAEKAAKVEAKADTVSTEDVIARIEQIDKEGAPLSTMKEVALLLQKERAKPENKTPDQQRKLNEALSKLLKAMSAARK